MVVNRHNWQFEYSAASLLHAARNKVQLHKSRLDFWSKAKDKVMAEIRESGIDVAESSAGSNYTKSGMTPHVVIDTTLQSKLTECHQKVHEHNNQIKDYEGWMQVMEDNPGKNFQLTIDDYLYFFGK